jgi:hypothetical protein
MYFYLKNVLKLYRSRLADANVPYTSFCYLDKAYVRFVPWQGDVWYRDAAVCFPYADDWTEGGTCVACDELQTEIEKGRTKDEVRIGYLNATCDPKKYRGPLNPVPFRYTNDVRWLRWFLESGFVFEGKKVGDNCSTSTGLSKARAYLDVLMKKHFWEKTNVNGSVSLTTTGMEGEGEELLYEEVKAELSGGDRQNGRGRNGHRRNGPNLTNHSTTSIRSTHPLILSTPAQLVCTSAHLLFTLSRN